MCILQFIYFYSTVNFLSFPLASRNIYMCYVFITMFFLTWIDPIFDRLHSFAFSFAFVSLFIPLTFHHHSSYEDIFSCWILSCYTSCFHSVCVWWHSLFLHIYVAVSSNLHLFCKHFWKNFPFHELRAIRFMLWIVCLQWILSPCVYAINIVVLNLNKIVASSFFPSKLNSNCKTATSKTQYNINIVDEQCSLGITLHQSLSSMFGVVYFASRFSWAAVIFVITIDLYDFISNCTIVYLCSTIYT